MKTIVTVPTINANDEVVVVVRWHVPDGGRVEIGALLVDVETTKAVVAIESEHGGWVRHRGREGDEIPVGAEYAWIFSEEAELKAVPAGEPVSIAPSPSRASAASKPESGPDGAGNGRAVAAESPAPTTVTRFSPAAAKLAASLGLDPSALSSSAVGLVTSAALRAWLKSAGTPPGSPPAERPGASESASAVGRRSERTPASKRAEIRALRDGAQDALKSSLTVYFDSAGVRAAGEGIPLALILSELAALLPAYPRFTAFHDEGRTVFYDAVRLGVAIDLGQGLKVVTLGGDGGTTPAAIERRLADLTLDYLENRLAPADVQEATFTVTDLSAFDVLQFEPLINGRQSAILGIGGDATLPGHPMSLTLAFDHRVLTGREVGLFLQALRDRILSHAVATGPTESGSGEGGMPCCDRCRIDLDAYYAKFGGVGVMQQYARRDGSTGLICHACLASF